MVHDQARYCPVAAAFVAGALTVDGTAREVGQ